MPADDVGLGLGLGLKKKSLKNGEMSCSLGRTFETDSCTTHLHTQKFVYNFYCETHMTSMGVTNQRNSNKPNNSEVRFLVSPRRKLAFRRH